MNKLTTAQAAAILQVSRRRVAELIKLGTLAAEKPGRDWLIDESSVEVYRNSPRKPGRRWVKSAVDSNIDSSDHARGKKESP